MPDIDLLEPQTIRNVVQSLMVPEEKVLTNRLDVTPGWNFIFRVYKPGPSVLDGTYLLPAARPIK